MSPRIPKNGFPRIGGMPGSKALPTLVSQPIGRILSGPSAAPAQRKLAEMAARQQAWPYPHSFPPPQAVRVHVEGIIPAPIGSTQTQVIQFQVDDGFQFAFTEIIQLYAGAGFVLGSTDIQWVLDVNTPITAPAGSTGQGYPIQGMSPSNIPKGAMSNNNQSVYSPWFLPRAEILNPLDILRSKVTTNGAVIIPGAPNYFITILLGWKWQTTN